MDVERVRGYFNNPSTVQHYVKAVANVGLWESEALLCEKHFRREDRLLDLGCGAGRIAFGLWKLGFKSVMGVDLAEEMVREAIEIADYLSFPILFQREDATQLRFADGSFEGVIFGFNGLMQIPGRLNRRRALGEVKRVLAPHGKAIFTTLDREGALYRKVFENRYDPEHDLVQNEHLIDYGDRHFATEHGTTFMHVPTQQEVCEDLEASGLVVVESAMRSTLARESREALEFSEDCRMWVVEEA